MAVKQGAVQTELGVLPEDWEIVPIGEAGQVLGGRQRSPHAVGELQKYLRVANVFDGHIDTQDVLEMPFSSPESLRFRLEYGDILLNEGQSLELVGRSAIYRGDPPECCFQNTLVRFRVNPGTLPEFAQTVFQNYLRTGVFASIALQTTSIAHLGAGRLATLKMPLPDKHEQQAIAEVIGDTDALIESLEKLLAKKRQIKRGAMQELLTGKKRLPGFNRKWELKPLRDLATIQRGASPRPIDSPIWFDDNSTVGWVRISDVTSSGMFLCETTQRLSPQGIHNSRPVSQGSLIMSICATVGRPVITQIDVCIHDGFVVFDNLRVAREFLYYVLKFIEDDWSRHGQTGSQMNLNTGLINRTEVSVPSIVEEQTAIAAVLSDMDAAISALETKLAKARQLKQGMMQELLTGRIRLV